MTVGSPQVAFGVPVRNGERWLSEALDSLLAQSSPAAGIAVVDDCSSDGTPAILRRYVGAGAIFAVRSEQPLGLVAAWQRAFARGSAGSGRRRRTSRGVATTTSGIPTGSLRSRPPWTRIPRRCWPIRWCSGSERTVRSCRRAGVPSATLGLADPLERLRATAVGMRAGDMIYGLHRVQALERAGGFPATLLPDRLLLGRLAVEGPFVQVERVLWSRRYRAGVRPTLARQRRTLFPGRAAAAHGPWWAWHVLWFFRSLPREAEVGRVRGAAVYGLTAHRAVARQRRLSRSAAAGGRARLGGRGSCGRLGASGGRPTGEARAGQAC